MAAFTLIELMFVLGLAATLASTAVVPVRAGIDGIRAAGAARRVVARLQQARVRAVVRGRDTAIRFAQSGAGFNETMYEDGNGNGVLSTDISAGVDVPVGASERMADQFPGVDFGTLPSIPGAEGSAAPGSDPIRLGSSDGVTFTPAGTATSGSLYILGRGGVQLVVRIYGETGRTRILKYYSGTGQWSAP